MSVAQTNHCRIRYSWGISMIPWYRQLISLIYGLGVIMIALWALEQGQGPYVILGVVGMSMLTLVLIFGVEISEISVGERFHIEFTDTTNSDKSGDGDE